MPVVEVNGVGQVEFPDSWDHAQIVDAIENDIIPQYKAAHPQNTSRLQDIQTDLARGSLSLPGMATHLLDLPSQLIMGATPFSNLATRAGEATGYQPTKRAAELQQQYSPQRVLSQKEITEAWKTAPGADAIAGAYVTNPMYTLGSIAESAPSILAGGLAGRGLGALTGVSSPAIRAGIGEGAVGAGQSAQQLESADVGEQKKAAAAAGAGTLTGLIGFGGAALARKIGITDPTALIAGGKQALTSADIATFKQFANRGIAKRVGLGIAEEGLIQELPQSAQEQMFQNWATGKPLFEGVPRAAVEGTLAGSALGGVFNVPKNKGIAEAVSENKIQEEAKAQAEIMKSGREEEQRQQDALDRLETEELLPQAQEEMARQDADIMAPPPVIPTPEETPQAPPSVTPTETLVPSGITEPTTTQPYAQETPAQPTVIDDATLTSWGIHPSNKKTRNALMAVGELTTPEAVVAAKEVMNEYLQNKNRTTPQINAGTLALERLDMLESTLRQQSEVMHEETKPTSNNTQTGGDGSNIDGQRTEQGIPLPPQRAPTTPQEAQGNEAGGVELPSGAVNPDNAISGRSEGLKSDALTEEAPTIPDSPRKEKIDSYLEEGGTWNADNKLESDYSEKPLVPSAAERAYINAKLAARDPQLSKRSKKTPKEKVAAPTEYSTPEEVQQAVGELLTPNQIARKPPIIVNDLSELEGDIPKSEINKVRAGGGKAFTYGGQDYYVASHIPKGNAKGTILHEKGAHLGLPKLIGEARIKALANRVNTWAKSATSPLFGKEKVEITIAKEAMTRANESGETPGSDRHNQEVIAYFAEIAVNDPKYKIDPLKNQPKEFDKVVGWLRDLWAGITYSLHKLHYAPEKLTAKDVVDLVMGAARVESVLGKQATVAENATTEAPSAQLSFAPGPQPTQQEKLLAQKMGIKLRHDAPPETIVAKIKARVNEATDNDVSGFLRVQTVGAGESYAYKHGTMYGTEAFINPLTGKELGFISLHRTLQADNIAMESVNSGFPYLDKQGVAHVAPSANNLKALSGLATKIRETMKADGMSEVLANTSFDYMLMADRYKELQTQGIIDPSEFTNAEYLYGKQLQAKYATQLKAWRDMHQAIREKTMKFLVDTGLFTPKKAKEFLDRMEYVPFNREMKPGESDGVFLRGLLSAKKEHSIKGSDRVIKDVMENIINNQVFLIKRGMANNTANLVADDMMRMNKDNPLQGGFEIPRNDKQGNNVEYLKNGKSQWFKVINRNDAAVFQAAPVVNHIAIRMARVATNMLRKGITLIPTFIYNQLFQDPQRASFTAGTKTGAVGLAKTSMSEFAKNAFGGESPLAREGRSVGLVGAFDYQDTYDNWNKEVRGATRTGISKWFEKAERVARAQDLSNRLAVYKDVMDHGGAQNEASARAIMMYNYQNRGQSQTISVLMALAPFINCKIQGSYRVLMALQGRIPGVSRADARKLVVQKVMTFAVYTMIYTMATSGTDDRERADENTANNNFLLGGTGVKIPVTPEFAVLKVAIEKGYRLAVGQQFETSAKFWQAMRNAAKNLIIGPSDINPTIIKPVMENAANYSYFTGKPLVGYNEQQKDVNLQFREGTSEFSKAISDALQEVGGDDYNISPIKIDNLVKGWFGSVGRDALYTADMMVGNKPEQKMNRMPLIGGAFYDMEGGALKSDLYDMADKSNKAWNTLAALEKSDPKKAKAYQDEHLPLLKVHDSLSGLVKEMDEIRDAKKEAVKKNPDTARAEISRLDTLAHKTLEKELPSIMKELDK